METPVDVPESNDYHCLHQVSGSRLLSQTMETGADRSAAEAGKARLFGAGSILTDITTEHTGEATRSRYGPKTLLLGEEIQATPGHTIWR